MPRLPFLSLVLVAIAVAVEALDPLADNRLLGVAPDGLSSRGNEFMIGFMPNNYLASTPMPSATIFVTTDEPTPVTFTVEADPRFGISTQNRTAEYGRTTVVQFPTGVGSPSGPDIRLITRSQTRTTFERNKYIRVKAEDGRNITVFGLNDEDVSTDAFLALPCQPYDGITTNTPYEYFIFSANVLPTAPNAPVPAFLSAFLIVTCENDTDITITPSQTVEHDFGTGRTGGGDSSTLAGQQSRQTIYFEATARQDLTGTTVTSTKPISVFVGHVCGRVPDDRTACDHLVEQVPPHVVWGTTFFGVPLARRMSGDRFIVGAIRDNTVINVTCTTPGSTSPRFSTSVTRNRAVTPQGSNYYFFDTPENPPNNRDPNYRADYCCIETNLPVAVMQYSKGHSIDEIPTSADPIGDPFMLLVPPVAQYLNNFTVTTAKEVRTTFASNISIAISTEFFTNTPEDRAAVLINGTQAMPEAGWIPIYCSTGSICAYGAQIGTPVGASTLVFNKPSAAMNAYVYGFEREISFAYPAGFEMEPIGFARVTISPVRIVVREDIGTVTLQVTRSGDISLRSRVFYNTRRTSSDDAAAMNGSMCGMTVDYVSPSQEVQARDRRRRFRDNAVTSRDGNIEITICDDSIEEDPESFEVYITDENPQNAFVFPNRVATVTILDNDGPPTIRFDPASYNVSEADGYVEIGIIANRQNLNGSALFYTEDDTATAANDFTGITSTNAVDVNFPPGSFSTVVRVPIRNDAIFEQTEQFFGRLRSSGTTAGLTIPVDRATVQIFDDDDDVTMTPPPEVTVEFDPTSYTVSESDGFANITVVKQGQTTLAVSVEFTTADGSAIAGEDYTSTSQTVTFQPAETSQIVMVPILPDAINEPLENFFATLSLPSGSMGVIIGASNVSTVSITDDDPVIVEFDPTMYTVTESEGAVVMFRIVKRTMTTQPVSVSFSTSPDTASDPADFTGQTNTMVTFAPGETEQIVNVSVVNDDTLENTETFTAMLSAIPGGIAIIGAADTATATITDDDSVMIQFDPVMYMVTEGGSTMLRIVRVGNADIPVSASISTVVGTAGLTDFIPINQVVTFQPGETEQFVLFTSNNDTSVEGTEMLTAVLSNPSAGATLGQNDTATISIADEGAVIVEFDPTTYTVTESEGAVVMFRIVKRTMTTQPVSVSFSTSPDTATDPADFIGQTNTMVTFAPGETVQIVNVSVVNDDTLESTETFTAMLSAIPGGIAMIGAADTATATITDDDSVMIQFDPVMYMVTEGGSIMLRIVRVGNADIPVSASISTVVGTAGLTDFIPINQVVTFQPGDTEQFVLFTSNNDTTVEGTEMLTAVLSNPSAGATLGQNNTATISIIDVGAVIVEFDPTMYTVTESEGAIVMFRIVKRTTSTQPVSVLFSTSPGTATDPADFTGQTNTMVTFAPGETEQIVNVPVVNDDTLESTETFTAMLTASPGSMVMIGVADTATATITDDDTVQVTFDPTDYTVNENDGTVTLMVRKIGQSAIPVTVNISTSDGSATDGTDFMGIVVRTLTFPPGGDDVIEVPIPLINDTINEPTEEFFSTLTTSDPNVELIEDAATVNIVDDDDVVVEFDPTTYTVTESEGAVVMFRIVKRTMTTQPVSVSFSTSPGTATDPADFTGQTNTMVTFAPGETEQIVNVPVVNDDTLENTETFTAMLSAIPGGIAMIGAADSATATITDDDSVMIQFDPVMYMVTEGGSTMLRIVRVGNADIPVSANISTVVGTAGSTDFIPINQVVTFQPGDTEQFVLFTSNNDTTVEGTEMLTAVLSNPSAGATLGQNNTATISIADEGAVIVEFDPTMYTVTESEGAVVMFRIVKRTTSTQPVSVLFSTSPGTATDPADFTGQTNTMVTFAPGETEQIVNVPVMNDDTLESTETFTAMLTASPGSVAMIGAADTATATITDDDSVMIQFDPVMYMVTEGGSTMLRIVRVGNADIPVSANISTVVGTAGSTDFIPINQVVTFQPGDTEQFVLFTSNNDTTVEGTEMLTAVLSNPSAGATLGQNNTATISIADEGAVIVEFDPTMYTVTESEGAVVMFRIVKRTTSTQPVSVLFSTSPGTATDPADFTGQTNTMVTFAPGETEQIVNVPVVNDDTLENTETFTAMLTASPGSMVMIGVADTATATITDDDTVQVTFDPTEYTVNEDDGTVTLMVRKIGQSAIPVTVNISTSDGSATDGTDFMGIVVRTLTFPPGGDDVIEVPIPLINDTINEPTEEFFSTLTTSDPNVELIEDAATVNIVDDDDVVVEFDPTTYTVTESEGAVVMFRIVKRTMTTQPVSVSFSTSPGTATDPADFTGQTNTMVTFAPGETEQIVNVPVVNDDTLENTETFTAMLTAIPGGIAVIGAAGTATATITDDDSVMIQFDPVMYMVTEGGSTMLRIVRVGNADIPVSANISTVVGTAGSTDFIPINQVVTFQPGDTEQFVLFTSNNDTTVEGTEMLTAVLSNPSAGATLGQNNTATISIADEGAVIVEFDPTMYTVTESEGAVVMFRIVKRTTSTQPVSVLFSTSPGTATDPADFIGQTNTMVTFAPGETEQIVNVPVVNDDTLESTETFTAMLTASPGSVAMIGVADTATATITDDDTVQVTFDPTEYTVNENDGTVTLMVRKIGQSAIPVTVNISTSNGSATDGTDFMGIVVRTLTFPPGGDDVINVLIPLINDTIDESTENFFSTLTTSDPNVELIEDAATVNIVDDDVVTVIPEPPMVEVPEDNGTVTVCYNTSTGIAEPLTISVTTVQKTSGNIATADEDYTTATRTITFPISNTATRMCTSFDITNDTIGLEGNESFTVRVGTSGPESWVTIIDDDIVEVQFQQPMYTVPEPIGNATVCLESNIGTKTDLEVIVTASEKTPVDAEDGMDFNIGNPQSVIFPAGVVGSTRCIDIEIIDDNVQEDDEGFNVDFEFVDGTGARKGAIPQTMVVIADNERVMVIPEPPMVEVPENNGNVTVCYRTNIGITEPFTISVTTVQKTTGNIATADEDYITATRTITFPISDTATRMCTSFDIIDDAIGLEGNESFTVRVGTSGPESWVTIIDDDIVEVEFQQPMYTVPESNGTATVCLESDIGTKTDLEVTVTASEKTPVDAQDGMDFNSGTPQSVTFPAGVEGSTRCIGIEIIDDNLALENNEGFNVDFEFVDGMGARKGAIPQTMVVIVDNDNATVVPEVPTVVVPEDNGTVTVCYNTSNPIAEPFTINVTTVQYTTGNIATADEDYTTATRTITFPISNTATRRCTSFDIINDDIGLEGNESFTIRVGTSGPLSWVTIIDDDIVEVEFQQPMYTVPESNGTATVCLESDIETKTDLEVIVTASEKTPVDAKDGMDFNSSTPQSVIFPAGVVGSTRCIEIQIIDDDVALENDEGFNVDFEFVDGTGARKGAIPQTMVVIVDNDTVVVAFNTSDVVVNEGNGTVTVCLQKDRVTDEPLTVEVTASEEQNIDNPANVGTDFTSISQNITFAPNETVTCGSVPIVDDNDQEVPEAFMVSFIPQVPPAMRSSVMTGMNAVAEVTIIDNDNVTNATVCSVTEPLMVSPFQSSNSYNFRGTCEHVLLSSCNGTTTFRVTVDFLQSELDNGRIGALYDGGMYISREDGTFQVDSNTEIISSNGNTTVYERNVVVTRASGRTTVDFRDLGVTIVHRFAFPGQDPSFQVAVSDRSVFGQTCGLCGTTEGILLYRDGTTTANLMNMTEVDAFANSYLVDPSDQFLHAQRSQCGQVTNDTVVGDPLFTVPISSTGQSLCFEVHGAANTIFNLVSDVCTTVNAHYTPMNIPENGNIINRIGVRAVPNMGLCKNVMVELDGCRAFIDGMEVIGSREEDGVEVRRMRNRVRISVPNCDNLRLVMWVMCQNISGQTMLRFVITRGLNLRPTSHGLIGQFWNTPVVATQFTGTVDRGAGSLDEDQLYVVTVMPQDGAPQRSFLAESYVRTWENRPGPCLYAGNAQAGWSGAVFALRDPVIQGRYRDYIVDGLFETDFMYDKFDEIGNCPVV